MRTVVAVLGPTAVGKSELAIALAQRLDGEIVNADSMQLYRGMDIGTAKLAPAERGGVQHHLLDVWEVTRVASVAEYQSLARDVIDGVLKRRRTPILVGGSGLYLRAVLDDLRFPGVDPQIRARLEHELSHVGAAALHHRLSTVDPSTAARITPQNSRRIVRALEVIEITGAPYSSHLPAYESIYRTVHIGLDFDADGLDARMADRVDRMWARGLVAEVRSLARVGLRDGVTARRALGYAQALSYLDGASTAEQARADTAQATRRFARRQRSWFRRDPRITWYDPRSLDPDRLARTIER